jgi:hypothetical protein
MPTKKVYGPSAPTKLALMGIRFAEGEGGAAPAVPAVPAVVPTVTPIVTPADPAQDPTDWKAESRKWEARSKENAAAAQKLAEFEESQKSDLQKSEDRANRAEKLAADSASDAIRARVALEKGLTPAQEKRLIGSTRDELLADADVLLTDLGKPAPTIPRADPSAGPRNEGVSGSVQAGRDLFANSRPKIS